jgi:hypothetical protein
MTKLANSIFDDASVQPPSPGAYATRAQSLRERGIVTVP